MATYSIDAPDGNTYTIEGPDGASQREVEDEVLRQFPSAGTLKPVAPEKGFLDTTAALIGDSFGRISGSAKIAPAVTAGTVGPSDAKQVAAQLNRPDITPPEMQEAAAAFKGPADEWTAADTTGGKLAAVGNLIMEVGGQMKSNPKGAVYTIATSAADMVPGILGMLAGGAAGAPLGPWGAMAAGAAGGTAASAPFEAASAFTELVGKELAARNLPATEENVTALLQDPAFVADAVSKARIKGVTTAGVENVLTMGAGRIMSAPLRAATKQATAELGATATKQAIADRAAAIVSQQGVGSRIVRAGASGSASVAGGGLSEAVGQQAAYGSVDLADVGMEMLGEVPGAAIEVPMAARAATADMVRGSSSGAEASALRDAYEAKVKASYEEDAKAAAEAAAQAEIDARPRLPAPEAPAAEPAPAAPTPEAPTPEPTLREKPAPAVPKEITPESVGESAYKYAQRTQGQKFLAKLQAVNPEMAQDLRKELVGNSSNKDALFTAVFGEGPTAAPYVEPAPVAESPLHDPTMTVEPTQEERVQDVESRVKELEAERSTLMTRADGKPPVARSPAGKKYADITSQIEALREALPPAPAPVAPAPVAASVAPAPVAPAPVAPAPVAATPAPEQKAVAQMEEVVAQPTPPAQAADTAVEGAGDTRPAQEAPVDLNPAQLVDEAPATPEVDALNAEVQKAESEFEANWAGKPMPKYGTEERGQYAAGQKYIESVKRKRDAAIEASKPKETKPRASEAPDADTGKDIELDGVEQALADYNASADDDSVGAKTTRDRKAEAGIRYLLNVSKDEYASDAAKARAKAILDEVDGEIDPKDVRKVRLGKPLLKAAEDTGKPKVEGLDDAVEAGDTREALASIRDSEYSSPIDKMVAERLMKFKDLPKIAKRGDIDASGQYDAIADEVQLKDVGIHTTLHEAVHGFLHRLIADHEAGLVKSPAIDNLRQLYNYVAKKHPEWRKTYGFKNLSEFASEAMSNATFQTALNSVPYQQTNAFTAFVRRVMQALGIKPTSEHTALMESIVQVDAALEQGRQYQTERTGTRVEGKLDTIEEQRDTGKPESVDKAKLSATSDDIIKTSKISNPEGKLEKMVTKTAKALSTREGVSLADKFRTIVVDNMAAASTRLNQMFDGKVRSSLGFINPEPLMRQAMDSGKMLLAWTRGGILIKDPVTKLWRVEEAQPDTKTFERVLDKIETWGNANGKTFPEAYAAVSKLLEAKRLQGIRASNAAGTTDIDINLLSKAFGGTTDSQIDALVADFDADATLQEIQSDLNEMRGKLIDNMVLAGRITAADASDWKSVMDYVPFSRIAEFEKAFKSRRGVGRGMTAFKSLPEIIGSEQLEVTNVLDNFVSLSGWMIQQTVRADAAHTALDMLRRMGVAQRHTSKPRIDESKVVSTYENGVEVWYSLPSRFDALAFAQPGDAALNSLMFRAFRWFSNTLRGTITALPPFAVKQVIDDIQRAYVYSGLEQPYKVVWPTLRNFAKMGYAELFGKEHEYTKELERMGLVGEFDFNTDKPAESILQDLGYTARGPVQKWVHRLQGITRASDLAVRAAVFERTLEGTKSAAMPDGDALKAQARAREFINFRRRGTNQTLNALGTMVPFMNAYVQGMDVLYRNATGKGSTSMESRDAAKRLFWTQGAKLAAMTAVYALLSPGADGDDEDKRKKGSDRTEVDERTRFSNWVLGGGVKAPVPREIAMIFKVPVETALDYMRRLGTAEEQEAAEATITVLRYALEQVSYGAPIPTAIRPVLEALTNTSFFTWRNLETAGQEKLDPSKRTRESTSELAKAISKAAEDMFYDNPILKGVVISPIKVDNFLNGYFGTSAAMVTMATDQALNPDRLDRPLAKYAFFSTFMYNKDVMTGRKDEFYELSNKVAPRLATLNLLMKRDPSKVEAYFNANKQAIVTAKAVQTSLESLGTIRQTKELLNSPVGAKRLTKDQREEKLKALNEAERSHVGWLREYRAKLAKQ